MVYHLPPPPLLFSQLLKYVPTEGEIESLEGNAHEVDRFAVADRFFYEMSRCAGALSQAHLYIRNIGPLCLWDQLHGGLGVGGWGLDPMHTPTTDVSCYM